MCNKIAKAWPLIGLLATKLVWRTAKDSTNSL